MTISDKTATKVAIKQAIEEMSNTWLHIESQQQHIRDIVTNISETYEYDKKLLMKVAKARHKRNLSEVQSNNEMLVDEYESLFGDSGE